MPAGKFLRSVNFYVYPSWRQEEIIPKYQRDNFASARQCPRCVQFLRRPKLAPKELITRCQRDNFAPEGFEIQIWVWNYGREVDYTKARGNEFPLRTAHFLFWSNQVETRRKYWHFKNPPSHPLINSLIKLEAKSLLRWFHSFYPWSQFTRIPDYPGGGGRFHFFEVQVWVWNLSLKFKFEF